MKRPNIFKRFIEWWKVYYWNVIHDLPRDRERSFKDKLKWIFLYPWYRILKRLAICGFLKTQEGYYVRLRDFTPFFWRVLVERAVRQERRKWEFNAQEQALLLESAKRELEAYRWLKQQLGQN